jgi:hypothetical protein
MVNATMTTPAAPLPPAALPVLDCAPPPPPPP